MVMLYRSLPLSLWFVSGVAFAGDSAPWGQMALHTFNLAVLLGVLYFFLGKKVKGAVAQRAADIQVALDQADVARKAAEERAAELEVKLKDLESRLEEIQAVAEQEAATEAESIIARAEVDAAAIRAAAERTIRDEAARAKQSLRTEAVGLAIELAGKQLEKEITADDQKNLVADFLGAVKDGSNAEVANG